eukprot:GILK01003326.1.p1 GENE.GILK01003326.1~~GILK01003326.1.p1  ORF type:complete len:599 (-),score=99.74 GILK01003326.1:200-1948(-)
MAALLRVIMSLHLCLFFLCVAAAQNSYDYVIIGAGSAGATVAARLTEDPLVTVVLVEAGPNFKSADTPYEMQVPNPSIVVSSPKFDAYKWPNLQARRTKHQQPSWYARGRGVGGTSSINGQLAIRGMLDDFEHWVREAHLPEEVWGAANALNYYKKLETDVLFGESQPEIHGSKGPVPINRLTEPEWGHVDRAQKEAAMDLGYGWFMDHNHPNSTGASVYAINSQNSRRVSTNDAYLEPARNRSNLLIVGGFLVDKILFEGRKAIGVKEADNKTHVGRVFSAKNVILSAGTIHSPAILMRSGVGPGYVLSKYSIPVVHENPNVGAHFNEHPVAFALLHLKPDFQPIWWQRHTNCIVRYTSGLLDGFENDMTILGANQLGDTIGRDIFSNDTAPGVIGILGVAVFKPLSRGRVYLKSKKPEVDPAVDCNLLSHPLDLQRMRDGFGRLQDFLTHPAVRRLVDNITISYGEDEMLLEEFLSQPRQAQVIDDWLLTQTSDAQHCASTCKMGDPKLDRTAVVDSSGRVIGVENLRVVDASIFPSAPRANTHLTVVAAAELLSDVIKREDGLAEWRGDPRSNLVDESF